MLIHPFLNRICVASVELSIFITQQHVNIIFHNVQI